VETLISKSALSEQKGLNYYSTVSALGVIFIVIANNLIKPGFSHSNY
jgi:hypothetical protein